MEGGKKYIFKVYCNSLTSGTYTFTAEQDNWVYAPNGGVQTCNEIFLGDYQRNIYVTTQVIEEIIAILNPEYVNFKIDTLDRLDHAIIILDLNKTTSDKMREKVGSDCTIIGGGISLLPSGVIVTLIGGTVSVIGTVTAKDWDGNNIGIQSHIENLELNLTCTQSRHKTLKFDYLLDDDLISWNSKPYINKYQLKKGHKLIFCFKDVAGYMRYDGSKDVNSIKKAIENWACSLKS